MVTGHIGHMHTARDYTLQVTMTYRHTSVLRHGLQCVAWERLTTADVPVAGLTLFWVGVISHPSPPLPAAVTRLSCNGCRIHSSHFQQINHNVSNPLEGSQFRPKQVGASTALNQCTKIS